MASHPLPPFDLFNVLFERIYDPTIHLVFAFDGEVDGGVLKTATLRLIAANPYLGCRCAEHGGMPVWEKIAAEEWERAFAVLPAGSEMPPPPLDVRRGPQVRVSLLREDGGDLVIVTCHHGFCDARGLLDMARDLFAVYRGIGTDPAFAPAPTGWYNRTTDRVLSRFSAAEIERGQAAEETFTDRWRFPAVRTGRGTPQIASVTLAPERLAQTHAFGKKYGATVNDVALAALFLALLKIRNDPADRNTPRSVLTSADLRRYLDGPVPPMNLSVAYEVTIEADENARLEDVLVQVAAATKRRKENSLGIGCILFYDAVYAGGMPTVETFFDDMMRRYLATGLKNPVFSNIGIFDPGDVLPLTGRDGRPLDLRDVRILPCVCWPYGFLVTLSTYRGAMTLVAAYEEGPYSRETVERFLDVMAGCLPRI